MGIFVSEDKKKDKNSLSAFWPKTTDEKGARDAAMIGASGAALVAVITAAISLYSAYSSPILG